MFNPIRFLATLYRCRRTISFLARKEFSTRYAGTLGGTLWAIFHPLATVLVFWLVFSVGLRIKVPEQVPFLLYFMAGLVPWLTLNEVLTLSTQAVRNNAQLIKKTTFTSEVLPVVYLLAALVGHAVMLGITCLLVLYHGLPLTLHVLQVFIYLAALSVLALGLGWIVAALNVLHRDVGQAISIVLNLWFWATPIVWARELLPAHLSWVLDLNPMTYIVEGYRNSLLYREPFWENEIGTLSFFLMAGTIFMFGAMVFHRLKIEFAEAL